MTVAERLSAARAFWLDEAATDDQIQAVLLIAQQKKFRPKYVLSLDADAVQQFHDLAAIARGQIPADLQQEQILAKMPAFFRAIRGQEYDENDLREMIEDVRKLHQPGN